MPSISRHHHAAHEEPTIAPAIRQETLFDDPLILSTPQRDQIAWCPPYVAPCTRAGEDPRVRALFERQETVDLAVGDTLSAVALDYVEQRIPSFSPLGQRVASTTDAACLLAVLRSPYVERLSWLLVDTATGLVADGGLHSVGTLNGTDAFADPSAWRDVKRAIDRVRPSGSPHRLYVCHNHPAGDISPSNADVQVYARIAHECEREGISCSGLILNGTHFSWMAYTKGADYSLVALPYSVESPWVLADRTHAPKANSPEAAANVARLLRHSDEAVLILSLDAHVRLVAVQAHHGVPSPDLIASLPAHQPSQTFVMVGGPRSGIGELTNADIRRYPATLKDAVTLVGGEPRSLRRSVYASWHEVAKDRPGIDVGRCQLDEW